METPERVKMLKTLKCGDNVYGIGNIIDAPIPRDLLAEIRANTGAVEALAPPPQPRRTDQFYCMKCDHAPFKTETALKTHDTIKHKEKPEDTGGTDAPPAGKKEVEDGDASGVGDAARSGSEGPHQLPG